MRRTFMLVTATVLLSACAARAPRLPAIQGALADVIIRATFADGNVPAHRLLIDSISFGRLGFVIENRAFSPDELRAQAGRDITLVDPADVLACPLRQPCHVRGNAIYVTLWDAARTGNTLELRVTRTYNVERLHLMTESVSHRLLLAPVAGEWRLSARQRLPG